MSFWLLIALSTAAALEVEGRLTVLKICTSVHWQLTLLWEGTLHFWTLSPAFLFLEFDAMLNTFGSVDQGYLLDVGVFFKLWYQFIVFAWCLWTRWLFTNLKIFRSTLVESVENPLILSGKDGSHLSHGRWSRGGPSSGQVDREECLGQNPPLSRRIQQQVPRLKDTSSYLFHTLWMYRFPD